MSMFDDDLEEFGHLIGEYEVIDQIIDDIEISVNFDQLKEATLALARCIKCTQY